LGRKYPWGNDEPDRNICNFGEAHKKTVEVQKFEPQMYGIYQMAGNIREWVADFWHNSYDDAPTDGSARVSDKHDSLRVLRGGWRYPAHICRSTFRDSGWPGARYFSVGFRLSQLHRHYMHHC